MLDFAGTLLIEEPGGSRFAKNGESFSASNLSPFIGSLRVCMERRKTVLIDMLARDGIYLVRTGALRGQGPDADLSGLIRSSCLFG